ncbi:MAG: GNAT family N-acetyltransferase [Caldilineaceae bacterium]|nr:GNAT family N-acetyltransferase [Caldilineaceae bacterium]
MEIRRYRPSDLETLKTITAICFDGVSIDQNIEQLYGIIRGNDWRWRKVRHIDDDAEANADGIFVAEVDGQTVGYVTTRVDKAAGIGGIPNFAVLPEFQQRGIGRRLLEEAVSYFAAAGLSYARIETLDQNDVGAHFYPDFGFREVARQIHYIMPVTADRP